MEAAVLILALVFEDDVSLRASARDGAPVAARLHRGEWLEVRGASFDEYRVFDPHRQRAGYVHKWQVRVFDPKDPETPKSLRTLIAFVRDSPGMETLGLGAADLFMDLSPAAELEKAADVFDAMGTMGARLAKRASKKASGKTPQDLALADHLAIAERFGARFVDVEVDERHFICEAGEAFRHVLSMAATPEAMARAALELTAGTCIDPLTSASEMMGWHRWRLDALARVDLVALDKAGATHLSARVRLREAETLSALVFATARINGAMDPTLAGLATSAQRALLLVDRGGLLEEDRKRYDETALRVAASMPATSLLAEQKVKITRRADGNNCLVFEKVEKCSYGIPWLQAARWSPDGKTFVVPLQTGAAWTELWIIDLTAHDDVIVPWATAPNVGYVELAGFSPDSKRLFIVREAIDNGAPVKRFQAVDRASLDVQSQAASEHAVAGFRKFASVEWRARTLALR